MSTILSIIQFLCVIGILNYEIKRRSISIFLWMTLFVMFAIPHLLNSVFKLQPYPESVMIEVSIFAILFISVYFLFRLSTKKIKIRGLKKYGTMHKLDDNYEEKIAKLFFVCLLFTVFYFTAKMVIISGSLVNINKFDVYKYNASKNIFDVFISYMYNISSGVVLFFMVKRKNDMFLIISIFAIVFQSLVSGSRLDLVVIFVAIISRIIILDESRNFRRKILKVGIIGVVAVLLIYALRVFRIVGGFTGIISGYSFDMMVEAVFYDLKTGDGEMGLINYFYYIVYHNNNFEGFEQGASYIRILLLPIPSFLLGGLKPPDFVHTLGTAIISDSKNFSAAGTLFADCYGNFGFFGFMLGIFWAFVMNIFDYIKKDVINIKNMSLISIMGMSCITIGRGSVYNPLAYVFYALLFFWCINVFIKKRGVE